MFCIGKHRDGMFYQRIKRNFRTVEAKLNLDEEDCEDLAVKAFQLKLLRGRLDQGNERISTTYAIKREFGPEDWKNLKNKVSCPNEMTRNLN